MSLPLIHANLPWFEPDNDFDRQLRIGGQNDRFRNQPHDLFGRKSSDLRGSQRAREECEVIVPKRHHRNPIIRTLRNLRRNSVGQASDARGSLPSISLDYRGRAGEGRYRCGIHAESFRMQTAVE